MFRSAQIAGHSAWWVFVVAAMLKGGVTWLSSGEEGPFGWVAYTPIADQPRRYADYLPSNGFDQLGAISLIGFCLLVLAALTEAVAAQRLVAGIITVAVPFIAATLIWCALPRGHWNFYLEPIPALVVILVAVAIREGWERRLALTVTQTRSPEKGSGNALG
ncbi:hypothetical protein GCM10010198_21830 [Nocardia seriolae]|nr:hypothetical protein C6575_34770 [Nocardia seriolae]RLP23566.1 hypothetical protein D6158_34725 [Nocardia seriolae]BEK99852.1 hypothetical protein NSER024013_77580 [Nocardia seriolae]GEM28757.1 hypothetical protein NS2_69960 [Nocardia seriolae NBRC 15557]